MHFDKKSVGAGKAIVHMLPALPPGLFRRIIVSLLTASTTGSVSGLHPTTQGDAKRTMVHFSSFSSFSFFLYAWLRTGAQKLHRAQIVGGEYRLLLSAQTTDKPKLNHELC